MKNSIRLVPVFVLLCSITFAQNKKEVKKYKIKSGTETLTETIDGKEKTFTESFQKFDKSGNPTEEIEYNKDGTFKKNEKRTTDVNGNVIAIKKYSYEY